MWHRLVVWLVLVCTLGVGAEVAAAPKWTRVISTHFVVVGDASERDVRQVAIRLERFRETVSVILPKASVASPLPTVVIVFDNERSFRPYKPLYQGKPKDVSGYFQGGPDANYIALNLERGEDSYPIIFHEFTHLMIRNVMASPPLWLGEGLAEYYSTFVLSSDGKTAQIGKPIGRHVALLREHFIPLADLLAADHASPLYNDEMRRQLFYAESWAWMHFLLMDGQGHTRELVTLLEKLAAGMKVEDAFRAAFGSDPASFQSRLLSYVQRSAYQFAQYTLRDRVRDDAEMSVVALSEAGWQAHLGDLLAHTNRLDDAQKRIEAARTLDPSLALPYASLGVVRYRQFRSADAIELWRQAVALEPGGFGSELARQWIERVRPARVALQSGNRGAGSDVPSTRPAETGEGRTESVGGRPAAAPQVVLGLRAVRSGEVRAEGDLAEIACRADGMVMTVKAEDREIRVTARTFADVDFVSFRSDKPGTISCGPRKPGDRVYVTWRPPAPGEKPPAAGIAGMAVAIEFLPLR